MIIRSVVLFALAGLAEIGGGYLMWLWLREGRPLWVGLVGAFMVVLYGVIPNFQPPSLDFGRVYAAYGGAFIALSLLWGWMVDGVRPDTPSTVGAVIALVGAVIIVYWPRNISL
jgi:small multidrug resistance family-3 protein